MAMKALDLAHSQEIEDYSGRLAIEHWQAGRDWEQRCAPPVKQRVIEELLAEINTVGMRRNQHAVAVRELEIRLASHYRDIVKTKTELAEQADEIAKLKADLKQARATKKATKTKKEKEKVSCFKSEAK